MPGTRPTTTGDIVRSLAFYAAFYGGSLFIVSTAVLTMFINDRLFRIVVKFWGGYHRFCCAWILRIRLDPGNIPPRGGVLYAFRHEAFFEAIDMPYYFDEPVVFAKYELMRIPLWGTAAARFGVVGVDRNAGARALRAMLTAARKLAANGRPLVIFPEGTRIPHGRRAPLQSGFAGIYKLLGLPIIPVAVDSGPLYHRRWKQPGTIHYRYGEEIPPGLPREEVEARVQAAINALNPEQTGA